MLGTYKVIEDTDPLNPLIWCLSSENNDENIRNCCGFLFQLHLILIQWSSATELILTVNC